MRAELGRAERRVEEQSVALKKPLGLGDLVLTQIVFVVGSGWVGTAAKLGTSHLFFWLLAILLFYIPQAAVVIYLSRLMPLEGGIYQWAKLAFNEFTGFIVAWNLWLLSIMVIALGGMFITTNISYALGDAAAWMRDSPWCVALISCVLVSGLGLTGVRGLSLGKWVHNVGGYAMFLAYGALIVLPVISLARGDLSTYRPLEIAAPAMPLFYCFNIFSKLAVGGLSGFEYVGILAGEAHAPARNIGRSVIIAAPIIALMFVLGTSSVLAFIGNNQLDHVRRRDHAGDCYFQPDRGRFAGSISTRGQRRECFLRNCLYCDVCNPDRRRCRDTSRRAHLAATGRRCRSYRMSTGYLLHD